MYAPQALVDVERRLRRLAHRQHRSEYLKLNPSRKYFPNIDSQNVSRGENRFVFDADSDSAMGLGGLYTKSHYF